VKTFIRLAAVALAIAAASPAAAQAQRRAPPPGSQSGAGANDREAEVGIGAGITTANPGDGLSTGGVAFVPINLGQFRIEPFAGWTRASVNHTRSSDFLVGVGGFLVKPVAPQVQLYAGGRLGMEWHSTRDAAGNSDSRRDTLLAGALGGEYLPVQRVALGAELQLALVSIGDGNNSDGGWATATQATFFARFYLF
jgi:hypothetical protein